MSPKRWKHVKEIVGGALEYSDVVGRSAFVSQVCADDTALQREVESLLATSLERLEDCAEDLHHSRSALTKSAIGHRLGAYEIVRELGCGGMGAVYLAERADQEFQKQVAIKILKRGTDTDEVLRRFRAEREILARLEHPNIARLIDGGTTGDLPYFVMEYVIGVPVTDFCATNGLSIDHRLRLFLKICAAVRFAHQNLVVHRDLKPANILITAEGEPKLLDFGIARLLEHGHESLALTLADQQRLTPAYASPEQVRGQAITTVSDVYALGALLYEILTGKSAHRFFTLRPTPTELLDVIVEQSPLRPSAVVTDATGKRRLRGDLDNIVLKALSKEPVRRYGGVGALAEDIRRYLEHRPVHARKDTIGYRTAKLFQRNKLAVAAAVVIVVTLLVGIIATGIAAREALLQRARAERRFEDVRKIANSLMLELHTAIKDLPGALGARQLVTRRALEYLDSLVEEAGDDLSLKSELATAYGKLGLVTFDVEQALAAHRKATILNEQLVGAAPQKAQYRKQLAESYDNLSDVLKIGGDSVHATEYAQKSLAVTQSLVSEQSSDELETELVRRHLALGAALSDAGDFDGALAVDSKALQIQEKISARRPRENERRRDLAEVLGAVSDDYENTGNYPIALEYGDKAMALAREVLQSDPTSARHRRNMWSAHFRNGRQQALTGNGPAALAAYTRAVDVIEKLSVADPADAGHRYWLAATYFALGELHSGAGQTDNALELYRKALAIDEGILAQDGGRGETRRQLAKMDEATGELFMKMGQLDRALEYLNKARAMAEGSAQHDPANMRVKVSVAEIDRVIGNVHARLAEHREKQANLQKAHACYQRSVALWREIKSNKKLRSVDEAKFVEAERALEKIREALK